MQSPSMLSRTLHKAETIEKKRRENINNFSAVWQIPKFVVVFKRKLGYAGDKFLV